jgi:fructosamine-3-kinase
MEIVKLFEESLAEIGDKTKFMNLRAVSGGDINSAYFIETERNAYFVKCNKNIPPGFFKSEAAGLKLLSQVEGVFVPKVYLVKEAENGDYGLLILEWIEGKKTMQTEEMLGNVVASLHQCYGTHFGLTEDNYIGRLPQRNGLYNSWIDYFRERRLFSQVKLAEQKGRMPKQRRDKMEKLLSSLDNWIPKQCQPSLLHGDLWSGNWIVGANGIPYLIDPSVFYGHFEFEIAFTELFGGFSSRFYEAYTEMKPLSKEYYERKELYQLYYLLVHLNLFGEMYGSAVDHVLKKYVG